MFCEKCGNPMPDTANFCEKCGAKVDTAPSAMTKEVRSPEKNNYINYADNAKSKNNKKVIISVSIVIVLLVVVIAGTLIIQATPANRLKRQLRLAEKYLTEMNYEQALIAYGEAIKIDPKCEQAYLAMADIYIKTGNVQKAVELLENGQKNIQTDTINGKLNEIRNLDESENQSQQTEQNSGQSAESPKAQKGIQSANVGEIITLGKYEQDNNTSNGAEPIEWLVLDKQGDRMLVISRYSLDCHPYNTTLADVTWETCTLRSWLNSEFYNSAFNNSEKASVITTTIENPNNARLGTQGGNATSDNVFCLSIDEAERYFASDEARATKPTSYAISRGAWTPTSGQSIGNSYWLLRSPGYHQRMPALILVNGVIAYGGGALIDSAFAVRPAMWVAVNP
ncbi:MAG: DUF6273 domain-containing protein [Bacteroides sp.]